MGNDALNRLLEAEKKAHTMMEEARKRAQIIVDSAQEESKAARRKGIENFHTRGTLALEESAREAQREAEKIKRDGIELANGLTGRSKTRIPTAVEEVMELLLNGI
jgi:vacuolar-type H+-ATPase subunit H